MNSDLSERGDDMRNSNEKLIKALKKECLYYKILCDKLGIEIYDEELILKLVKETHDEIYGE
jgi:hypothetical protein